MEPSFVFSALAANLVLCLGVLLLSLLRRERHKMIGAGLRNRAFEASEALTEAAIDERGAGRPAREKIEGVVGPGQLDETVGYAGLLQLIRQQLRLAGRHYLVVAPVGEEGRRVAGASERYRRG